MAVPENISGALVRYIVDGLKPGSGLSAILSNDLKEAIACCDDDSWDSVREVVRWLYHYAPTDCYGSAEKVQAWDQRDLTSFATLQDGLAVLNAQ